MFKQYKWPVFLAFSALAAFVGARYLAPVADWRAGTLTVILPRDQHDESTRFETELLTLFAQQLNIRLHPVHADPAEVAPLLQRGQAHLAAGGLRKDAIPDLHYSDSHFALNEAALCKAPMPHDLPALAKRRITVVAGSSQEAALRARQKNLPDLTWQVLPQTTQNELLHQLADGALDCTVASAEQIASARNFHPELETALDLASPSHFAWAFPPEYDDELYQKAQKFLQQAKRDGTLKHLIDHHFGHNERLEEVDAAAFITQTETLLPHFRPFFEEAAQLTGVDWKLLAALAYQESHWNPQATSFTNVRGMMMMTEDTAERMNLPNRLDARSSILAGAQYLQLLESQLPARIPRSERIWMALAAYNQGMGHLEDARVLAARMGLNPDSWTDLKKALPLLAQAEFSESAKHGSARGGEAVIMVETVRLYHDMLQRTVSPPKPASCFARLRARIVRFFTSQAS